MSSPKNSTRTGFRLWRENINYIAPHRILTRAVDKLHTHIARADKKALEPLGINRLIQPEPENRAHSNLARHCILQRRVGRGNNSVARAVKTL